MDNQGNPQPVAGNPGHQLRPDRGPSHGGDADGIHVPVRVRQIKGRRHSTRLRQLSWHLAHLAEHVAGVDELDPRGIIQGDRLVELGRR